MKKAIIVDLDGTLAQIGDRDVYDAANCHVDTLNPAVALVLHGLVLSNPTCHIIICSGRSVDDKAATVAWLESYGIAYHHLFMRPSRDRRMDAIVKQEILFDKIFGDLEIDEVLLAMDDRQQVVDMWRAHGIPCFQVNESPDE